MLSAKAIDDVARQLYNERPLARDHATRASYVQARADWVGTVFSMQDVFAKSNPKFDRNKFAKTCGVGQGD